MTQPIWRCIAQLGDASPTEYGGHWVFIDETGVYPPEAEVLFVDEEGDRPNIAYRYPLEKCYWNDGVLSDNKYHKDHPAWFADDLDMVSRCMDEDHDNMIDSLCNDGQTDREVCNRANAYHSIGSYHGFENFDGYPLQLSQQETESRYADERYKVQGR